MCVCVCVCVSGMEIRQSVVQGLSDIPAWFKSLPPFPQSDVRLCTLYTYWCVFSRGTVRYVGCAGVCGERDSVLVCVGRGDSVPVCVGRGTVYWCVWGEGQCTGVCGERGQCTGVCGERGQCTGVCGERDSVPVCVGRGDSVPVCVGRGDSVLVCVGRGDSDICAGCVGGGQRYWLLVCYVEAVLGGTRVCMLSDHIE